MKLRNDRFHFKHLMALERINAIISTSLFKIRRFCDDVMMMMSHSPYGVKFEQSVIKVLSKVRFCSKIIWKDESLRWIINHQL
jgi:hypothetical protein